MHKLLWREACKCLGVLVTIFLLFLLLRLILLFLSTREALGRNNMGGTIVESPVVLQKGDFLCYRPLQGFVRWCMAQCKQHTSRGVLR